MAEPNYMAYAQYMGARNPIAEGLNQLGSTLGDIQKNQIDRENMKRRNTLADLQMQQGQMQMDDAQAQQGAKQDVYGVTDPRAAYAAEMRARQQAERADRTMKHVERIKAFKAMGATPQFLTEFTKSEMMQDPEMAKMAPFVSFVDDTKMEITKPFKDGELRDPLNPSLFLPAGTYKVIAKASGDPRDPYRFDKIEPVAAEKEQNMTVEQLTSKALKGDKHSQAILDAMQRRELDKSRANRAIITTSGGGGRGGGSGYPGGKTPIGYRFTEYGDLEPIPGGPADQKVTAAEKAQSGAVQSIDTALASVKELIDHPGRKSATGASSITNRIAIPGGDARTFLDKLETFKSQMFVPMVQQMKGMGQLSDAEGRKLTAAVGALEPTMSESAFKSSLQNIIRELETTRNRSAKPLTSSGQRNIAAPSSTAPKRGAVIDGYRFNGGNPADQRSWTKVKR